VTDDRSNSALKPGSDINQPETGEAAVADVASADNPARQDHVDLLQTVAAAVTTAQVGPPEAAIGNQSAAWQPSDPLKFNKQGWWIFVILLLVAAVVFTFLVAQGTAFDHAHRLAAAGTALLDVVAPAALIHVILVVYQSGVADGAAADAAEKTLAYRRRGLKAAVIGQDGRASTSKTQVVLWTGAVVWALVDLLLLARAYPGGNLFTGAVTSNWRPEYLVLLGLPVAAATAAKVAVTVSNGGKGPVNSSHPDAQPGSQARVYVRDPVSAGVKGIGAAVAELIAADDGTVAWADLQYVVFTLITLVYFAVQVLAQPQNGLPPVPAALLTLMGVSASGYAANKIMETKGSVPT
jgi:hypothetical protein